MQYICENQLNFKTIKMKKLINYVALGILVLGLFAFISNNNEEKKGFHESFAATLKNAKAYTLEVAEKMIARFQGTVVESFSLPRYNENFDEVKGIVESLLNR